MSTNGSSEPGGKIKIDGKVYEIPSDYKISEYKLLTSMSGVKAMSEIDFTNPDAIAAVALILLRRENPEYDQAQLDDVMVGFVDEGDALPPAKTTPPAVSGALS